jgi:tRNA(fMet)-specific endonuclease VapC
MFVLDTDHVSLFQRDDPHVSARVLATQPQELATTVITVEEQLRGRLDRVRRARSDVEVVRAYHNLLATFLYFRTITIIGFDEQAQRIFRRRNVHDFAMIPSLNIENWSLPRERGMTDECAT